MAASSWGKQPPKKSDYTPPALSTPNFWGPAPVPPKVYTVWEEIWGEDGGEGTAFEGQESLEPGKHQSFVAPPIANDLEADSPGFESEDADGRFRAEFEGGDPNTEGSFRAMFDGLDPNTEGSFRRLMGGGDPNTEGNFQATADEAEEADDESEDDEGDGDRFGERLHQEDKITGPNPFAVDPYERSGDFQAIFDKEEDVSKKYNVIPFSGLATPSGVFDPNPTSAQNGQAKPDPFVGQWNFRVKIDGISVENSKFVSVSGITSETEAISYKFSGDSYMQSLPGVYKFSDVELTRIHKAGSDDFYKWREMIERGVDDQRTVTIHLHNVSFKDAPVMTMVLHDAWPIKWEFPELNAGSSDGAMEKITLNVSRVTKG
jgi:phage tail-like protein